MKFDLVLNGRTVTAEGAPMDRLLDVLRAQFALNGTKEGCGEGECGACTVLLDDEPVLSCLVPLIQCRGRRVETIEGFAARPENAQLLDRFVAEGGTQCGACTPGILLTASKVKDPSRERLRAALAGNLCRCTGYEAILRALVGPEETPR